MMQSARVGSSNKLQACSPRISGTAEGAAQTTNSGLCACADLPSGTGSSHSDRFSSAFWIAVHRYQVLNPAPRKSRLLGSTNASLGNPLFFVSIRNTLFGRC